MPSRNTLFATDEFYHCFNRGVDKRIIFQDAEDFHYFLTALDLFNQTSSHGDMRHYKQTRKDDAEAPVRLVSVIAYCLNLNHFHLLLQQEVDGGITQFMRKVGTGYTMYFNKKYKRSGSLFQGQFKSVFVESDVQLQHLFAYVTSNNLVHNIIDTKKYRSSFTEITEQYDNSICNLKLIETLFDDDIKDVIKSGIDHTIKYRASIAESEKSEFLE